MKLSKETINTLTDFLDEQIKLSGIYETLDGLVIKTVLNVFNNKFGDQIPDELNPVIDNLVAAIEAEDWDEVVVQLSLLLSALIHTPLIDGTPEEIEAYKTLLVFVFEMFENLLEKKI